MADEPTGALDSKAATNLLKQLREINQTGQTGALDSETAAEIFGILKKIQEDGKTIIIVTHDPVIAGKCERTIHIVDGKNTCPDGEMGI